jgi:uncharacterized membrane protein
VAQDHHVPEPQSGFADEVPVLDGLRRNAPALVGGAILLVALWLLPSLAPPAAAAPELQLVHGRILTLLPPSEDPSVPDVRIQVLDRKGFGQVLDGHLQGPSGSEDKPRYGVGDEVVVEVSTTPEGTYVAVSDRWRIPALGALLGVFALVVTVVGGWRGVRSLLALALTLGVIVKIVVPLLLKGWDPVPLAVGAATGVTIVTFLLTEGWRRSTFAAAVGTFLSLALAAGLATIFNGLAQFTALQANEAAGYLSSVGQSGLDVGGLLLAAVIFGALGILDDVTVTQAATVHELHDVDPWASRWELYRRSMNIGRSHIAATVNTLVLAYVGASLPLLVLFAVAQQDPLLTASGEVVAVDVVKALVGSIGIATAVPLTSAVAVILVQGQESRSGPAPAEEGR